MTYVTRFSALLVVISMLLLISAPFTSSHDVGDTYSYKIYVKTDESYDGFLVGSLLPNRLVLEIKGTTEFSITGLSEKEVSLRLRPNLKVSGHVEPSSFQGYMQEFLNTFNAALNTVYETSVSLDVFSCSPYEGLDLKHLGVRIGEPPYPLSLLAINTTITITTTEFTTWRGVPALHLKLKEEKLKKEITSTQYVYRKAYVECEFYLDSTTFLILYFKGKAIYNYTYGHISMMTENRVIEVESELINIEAVKHVSLRAYRVGFERGESRIYVASKNLSILSLEAAENELVMNIYGSGISGVTIFLTRNIRVKKILVDNTSIKYQTQKYGDGNIIKIPLTLSSREVRIIYEEPIKSVEEIPTAQTGINALIIILAVLVVPLAVLIALLTYLLKKRNHTEHILTYALHFHVFANTA